jgi:hypothetical protein
LFAAGGLAVLVACAQQGKGPETITGVEPPRLPTPQDEILSLESEMSKWRVELGLKPRPVTHVVANGDADEVCEGLTECKDPCNLAEAICQNADKICEIAEDTGDDWSRDKCRAAKLSCAEAREVCTCCEKRQENGLLRGNPCAPTQPAADQPEVE